jgi:hypothetical protein
MLDRVFADSVLEPCNDLRIQRIVHLVERWRLGDPGLGRFASIKRLVLFAAQFFGMPGRALPFQ